MALLLAIAFGPAASAGASSQSELDALKAATAQFQSVDAAMQAGYQLVQGLDHCFDNPGVGAMGYHYINPNLLDLTVQALTPEAMVYEADANGQLSLVAVEFIVPAKEWDAANAELPTLYGQRFHLNEKLGVHVLHAWIGKNNPNGVYEDWNPTVSCRALSVGAVGMPRTGSLDILPAAMAAISTMVLLLGVYARRRGLRPQ